MASGIISILGAISVIYTKSSEHKKAAEEKSTAAFAKQTSSNSSYT